VTTADPRGKLHDERAALADHDLRIARPVPYAKRFRGRPGCLDGAVELGGKQRARPDVRERDPERRRFGDDAVGHGQWREPAVDRERVDGDLAAGHELLDEDDIRARLAECELERAREHRLVGHEHEPLLALPVGRLDHARVAERAGRRPGVLRRCADDMPRVWHPGFREAFALAELRGREHRGRGVDRVRQHEPFRDPRRDRDRPVDSGRNEAVDPLGGGEPVELRLVLDRDDCAAVCAGEPGRRGIAVGGDHVEAARTCGLEQPELSGPGP
jgi:hypothetical protein